MKCALYARVSTDRQAEKDLSIPAQLRLMREFADTQGWAIVDESVEPGFTATNANRPALQRLLGRIQSGELKVDIVLAHKINRLSRSVDDYAPIRRALREHGVRLLYVQERVDDSPAGRLMENLMVSVAEFESANLSTETKKGMRERVLQGGWPHRPPRGYVMVRRSGDQRSQCEVHPREGPLMARAFELYATGRLSIQTIAKELASSNVVSSAGTHLSHSYVRKVLANPFYMGRIRWQGLDVQGNHRALVTPDLFGRVQAVLRARFEHPQRWRTDMGFPLKGIARCARCRGHMTAERHGRHHYYRCCRKANDSTKCDARYCRADRAHADIVRILRTLQINRSTARAIEGCAVDLIRAKTADGRRRRQALEAKQRDLLQASSRLSEAFLDRTVTPASFQEGAFALRAEDQSLQVELTGSRRNGDATLERLRELLRLSTSLADIYGHLSQPRQQQLLHQCFREIILCADGIAGSVLRSPFAEFRDGDADLQSTAQAFCRAVLATDSSD